MKSDFILKRLKYKKRKREEVSPFFGSERPLS
jgi:hypothetical protein